MRRAIRSCGLVFVGWISLGACSGGGAASPAAGAAAGDAGAANGPARASADGTPPACAAAGDATAAGPSARGDVAGALDPTGTTVVVFGGDTAVPVCTSPSGAHTHVAETWTLDVGCHAWTKLDPGASAAPPARARHAMATDVDGDRAILFGGRARSGSSGPYTAFADVWAFDFAARAWSEVATSGAAPSPRSNTAIAVDRAGGAAQLVVFGGSTDTTGFAFAPQNDTYALDLASGVWRSIGRRNPPPARLFHAMAVDQDARVAYVVSGGDENAFTGPFLHDVWALDLAADAWTEVKTTGDVPLGRIDHGVAFDAVARRLVVFGGHDDGDLGNDNDLYALDVTTSPATWTHLPGGDVLHTPATAACVFAADFTTIDRAAPERRSAFAFAPRADGRAFAVFGGKSDCGLVADAWWWADGAGAWSALTQSPVGLSCLRFSTTCSGLCG